MRDREKERQRHKQAPHSEPDAGLDPRTPGSHPEPKAGAQLLSHPGVPSIPFSNLKNSQLMYIQVHWGKYSILS